MRKVYYNSEYSDTFKKNDCPEDLGSTEVFSVDAAKFVSYISQNDADRKAISYVSANGQSYANRVGGCCKVFYSIRQVGHFFSTKCGEGTEQVDPIVYEVEAGKFHSTISQDDADWQALKHMKEEGQKKADAEGVCKVFYLSDPQRGWFKKRCREGWSGPERRRSLPSGVVRSFISKEDANNIAKELLNKEGQEWVEYNTSCEPDVPCKTK